MQFRRVLVRKLLRDRFSWSRSLPSSASCGDRLSLLRSPRKFSTSPSSSTIPVATVVDEEGVFKAGKRTESEVLPLPRDSSTDQTTSDGEEVEGILETPRGTMSREVALRGIAIIQRRLHNRMFVSNSDADVALKLLERLLEEEALTRKRYFGRGKGFVINVLKACRRGRLQNLHRLRRVIGLLESNSRLWDEKVLASVVGAMSASKSPDAPEQAQALLDQLQFREQSMGNNVKPNTFAYNFVLSGYAKRGMPNEAEQLLKRMHDICDSGELQVEPDTVSYNCVMNALAKSNRQDAPERANKLFVVMKELHSSGFNRVEPDHLTYNALLQIYARNGMAHDAEELLQQMHKLYEIGELKNGPDTFSYNSVIMALVKSCRPNAPECAKTLLHDMQEMNSKGHNNIQPNGLTYNILVTCFSRANMSHEAEDMLMQMHSLCKYGKLNSGPSFRSYSQVINALTKCNDPNAPDRAKTLLRDMREEYGLEPKVLLYNSLLECYANRGLAKEAEHLLRQMYKLHRDGQLRHGPNTQSFAHVMDAWANSDDPNSSQAEKVVLEWMEELHKSGYPRVDPAGLAKARKSERPRKDNKL